MWSSKWFGWVLSSLGAIPVTRGTADREAMKRAVAVLEAGEPLVLYPEGERKSGPVVQPMFDGAVYIALKAGVPIIPVGIGGSERVMPKSAKFIYPRKVRVVIGEALHPNVPAGEGSRIPRSAIAAQSAALQNFKGCSTCRWWGGLVVPTGVISRPECNERLSERDRVVNPQSSRANALRVVELRRRWCRFRGGSP